MKCDRESQVISTVPICNITYYVKMLM